MNYICFFTDFFAYICRVFIKQVPAFAVLIQFKLHFYPSVLLFQLPDY